MTLHSVRNVCLRGERPSSAAAFVSGPGAKGRINLSRRRGSDEAQGEHSGLGLGVFIARTLLERTGAKVSFTNRVFPDHGAVVQIIWPRSRFEASEISAEPPA